MVTPPAPSWAGAQAPLPLPPAHSPLSALPPVSPGETLTGLACVSSVHMPTTSDLLCQGLLPTPRLSLSPGVHCPWDRVAVFSPSPFGLCCCGAFLERPPPCRPHEPSLPSPPSTYLALPTGWVVGICL